MIGLILFETLLFGPLLWACLTSAVSVVRCKECKWAKANGTYQWCGRLDSTARITADDFCSYGERKESE